MKIKEILKRMKKGERFKSAQESSNSDVQRLVSDAKLHFTTMLDGVFDQPPLFKGIDTFTLGVCKLECIDNVLHVYLRRPGLLIGKHGATIDAIKKELDMDIHIHEANLLY